MPYKSVDPVTLQKWLAQGTATVVDVREPAEYRARHIAQAHPIPLSQVSVNRIPKDNRTIVVHCQKGGRGASACEKLLKESPDLEVYNLTGGLDAWAAEGLPLKDSGSSILSLDRQVQLTIGLLLMISSLLVFFVSPLYVAISAALSLGLILAGTTGFCGLAYLMSYAPWNK